jgi:ribonuclease R
MTAGMPGSSSGDRSLPGRTDILRCLREADRALGVADIAQRLRVTGAARRRLREALTGLVLEGALSSLPGQRYRVANGFDLGNWEGLLSVHPRGFAFVNASGREDVFIPPPAIGAALHGDTVRVAIVARTPRGPEGRVDAIIRRRNPRISGVLRRRRKSAWLEPDDDRIRGPIVIKGGDPAGSDGMAAVATITRFPESADENPEGELLSVLGTPGEAEVEVAKILARDNIREERDPAVLAQAEARAAELSPVSLEGRKDLRKYRLVTIDPVDARDHDDAIYVERTEKGYRAYVAIADVSEYVQPGSAVDRDASERCFTTYLPDRAVPMLPAVLASQQCSLLPDQDRYALTAIVDLDKQGDIERFRVVESVIRVAAKLTYEDVAITLGMVEGVAANPHTAEFKSDLRLLNDLAKKLRKTRMRRGALDLDLPEPRVTLDPETGRPVAITRRAKNPGIQGAYQMVEELMLLANERVARWLSGRKSPAVYRVHAPPDPERLEQLAIVAQRLGVPFEADTLDSPLGVSRWLKRAAKHALAVVLESLLLRSLKQAQYDVINVGHFGLASECYVHFTSPIRRYPDLLVHRIVKHLLRGGRVLKDPDAIESLRSKAARSSEIERVVMQAEREVVDVYRCVLMRDSIGQVYEGRVTSFSSGGAYVVLDEPFVDVLIRFESIGPDRYEVGSDGLSVRGQRSGDQLSLGDRVTLVIEDVGLARRTIYGKRIPPERVVSEAESLRQAESLEPTGEALLQAQRRAKGKRSAGRGLPVARGARDGVARQVDGRSAGGRSRRGEGGFERAGNLPASDGRRPRRQGRQVPRRRR